MQIKRFKIVAFLFLVFNGIFTFAQSQEVSDNLLLVSDRNYCVSGDTVWFKVWLPESLKNKGNVVHVQLDTKNGNLIKSVAKKTENNWAEGFIPVPDSLSTGQCFITAFLNAQREKEIFQSGAKSLLVFNRFEESVQEMDLMNPEGCLTRHKNDTDILIHPDKTEYATRETVNIKIQSNSPIKEAVVKASRVDPVASTVDGNYSFEHRSSFPSVPDFVEHDGVLLSGRVTDKSGHFQSNTLVVLSISEDPPYFDYYVTGEKGDFHFFLKNAKGQADVVIQAISEKEREYTISVEVNALKRNGNYNSEIKLFTPDQSASVLSSIKSDFFNKLFKGNASLGKSVFEMPMRFEMPFYGVPTYKVILDDFFDLPDFSEISRELLQGVQFRQRQDEYTIRLVDNASRLFFEDEPLRLLNGIPVFKNSLLASLKSSDIDFINIVQDERIFGDVRFMGILSVSLYDKSNSWIANQPNMFQYKVDCLQLPKNAGYLQENSAEINQPDIRQVFLWNRVKEFKNGEFEFQLSDLKGKIEITIEGITPENRIFRTSKIIEVK